MTWWPVWTAPIELLTLQPNIRFNRCAESPNPILTSIGYDLRVRTRSPLISVVILLMAVAAFPLSDHFFSQAFLDRIQRQYGQPTVHRVLAWEKMLKTSQNRTEMEKLEQVNRFFIRSTANVAHELDIQLIASGVEDTESLALLETMGFDAVQGHGIESNREGPIRTV